MQFAKSDAKLVTWHVVGRPMKSQISLRIMPRSLALRPASEFGTPSVPFGLIPSECETARIDVAAPSEVTPRVTKDYAQRSPRPRSYKRGARVSGFFTLFHTISFLSLKYFLSLAPKPPLSPR